MKIALDKVGSEILSETLDLEEGDLENITESKLEGTNDQEGKSTPTAEQKPPSYRQMTIHMLLGSLVAASSIGVCFGLNFAIDSSDLTVMYDLSTVIAATVAISIVSEWQKKMDVDIKKHTSRSCLITMGVGGISSLVLIFWLLPSYRTAIKHLGYVATLSIMKSALKVITSKELKCFEATFTPAQSIKGIELTRPSDTKAPVEKKHASSQDRCQTSSKISVCTG